MIMCQCCSVACVVKVYFLRHRKVNGTCQTINFFARVYSLYSWSWAVHLSLIKRLSLLSVGYVRCPVYPRSKLIGIETDESFGDLLWFSIVFNDE